MGAVSAGLATATSGELIYNLRESHWQSRVVGVYLAQKVGGVEVWKSGRQILQWRRYVQISRSNLAINFTRLEQLLNNNNASSGGSINPLFNF